MSTMHGMELYARHGIISRVEVMEKLNLAPHVVDHRVHDGSLVPVHRGVYRFRGAPDSWESRAWAAQLYAGPEAAFSHHCAAWLHGLDGFERPEELQLLVPAHVQLRAKGIVLRRTRESFKPYTLDEGFRVTDLARTLIDLADVLETKQLEAALSAAWRKQRTMRSWLTWTIKKLKRVVPRGLTKLLPLIERSGGSDSGLELEVLRIVRRVGLPEPQQQLVLHDANGRVMRVDNGWPSHRLVLHVDSTQFHGDAASLARDARQRNRLQAIGWRQFVVTKRTLDERAWVQQLASILRGPPSPG